MRFGFWKVQSGDDPCALHDGGNMWEYRRQYYQKKRVSQQLTGLSEICGGQ